LSESWLGLISHFDTNFLDDPSAAAAELRQLDADGWIMLRASDAVGAELSRDRDEERRSMLRDEATSYPEAWGPAVKLPEGRRPSSRSRAQPQTSPDSFGLRWAHDSRTAPDSRPRGAHICSRPPGAVG